VRTLVDAVLVVARHDHDDEHAKCQLIGEPKDAVIQLVGPWDASETAADASAEVRRDDKYGLRAQQQEPAKVKGQKAKGKGEDTGPGVGVRFKC